MKFTSRISQRLLIASALVSSLLYNAVAASAQTTAAPAAVTSNATNVSTFTIDSKARRDAELERESAEARRVEFRHQGTSL